MRANRPRPPALLLVLAWAWLPLLAGGCRPTTAELDAQEEQLPRMEEAKRRERDDDIDGAVAIYRDLLARDPHLAKAHLELGLLMDKHRRDDVAAIYHYRQYLELRPETEKRAMIEQLVQFAEFSLATSITNHPSALVGEITRLQEQIAVLEADLGQARSQIDALKQTLARERNRTSGSPASTPPAASASGPRTYRVQRGDTLSRIAQKVYNDSTQWNRIYQANRAALKSPTDLVPGQTLTIP